jgi:threonine dehydrogenase-like Zn-dependent dehydrogenase
MVTLATAVRAATRAGDLRDRRIAIVGPGHAGLLLLQVCLTRGVRDAVVFGTRPERLALARTLGAQSTVNVRSSEIDRWRAPAEGDAFDTVFEASGTPEGLAQAMAMTWTGGTIVAYGIFTTDLRGVPGHPLYARELTIVGSRGATAHYQEAVTLLAQRRVQVEPLVTHRLSLDEAGRGFSLMIDRSEDALRIILTPQPGGFETGRMR